MSLEALDGHLTRALIAIEKGKPRRSLYFVQRRTEAVLRGQIRGIWRALRAAVQVETLARVIRDHGNEAAMQHLPFGVLSTRLRTLLLRSLSDTYQVAGDQAATQLKQSLLGKDVTFETRVQSWGFDVLNGRGLQYLSQYGAARVTQITDATRDALRQLLSLTYEQGLSPLEQAKIIKEYIGLTEQQTQTVENLKERLTDDGLSSARVDQLATRKATELLDLRALNIARTETMFALAAGVRESRAQAADEGLINPATVVREWSTAEDEQTCPICSPMDHQGSVGLSGTFTTGDGEAVDDPPVHVNCRCTTDLKL